MEDKFYSLEEISKWQLSENNNIKLPALQRSFVWKPYQIETIWDSILRGFPIGSFLLSNSNNEDLFLLDGQQRATSIALGFYNPWENDAYFFDKNIEKNTPTVWIDLYPNEVTTTHKYVIRVLTKSHPWGYRRKNNNAILGLIDRRNALEKFKEINNKVNKYTDFKNIDVFPWDADLPVPLAFVLDFVFNKIDKNNFIEKCNNLNFIKHNTTRKEKLNNFVISNNFDEFINNIKTRIEDYTIPSIITKKEILSESDESENNHSTDPTLFVRLNREGTRLEGEELIYSIYKSEFPESKDLIENISANFIRPSLLISLFSRIAWSKVNDNQYPRKFSVNDFRKRLYENIEFKNYLKNAIESNDENSFKNIFNNALKIFTSDNKVKFPLILVKSMINNMPELFLGLLFWLSTNSNNLKDFDYFTIKKRFFLINLFCINTSEFVHEIWSDLSKSNFWTDENFKIYERESNFIFPFITLENIKSELNRFIENDKLYWNDFYPVNENLSSYFNGVLDNKNINELEKEQIYRNYWDKLFNAIAWDRNILIFVQRDYFENNFSEFNSLDVITDTNRPWDWDHIYPASWVYYKKNVDRQIRDFHNFNCNFRAMSLEENRSESNYLSPSERFEGDDKKNDYFIKDNDWNFWQKVNDRINNDTQKKSDLMNAFVIRFYNFFEEIYKSFHINP